ncbi:hypothetical protein MRX96_009975 [Rhipicephalus microplus]
MRTLLHRAVRAHSEVAAALLIPPAGHQDLPEGTHGMSGISETTRLKHGTVAGLNGSNAGDHSLTNS